MKHTHHRATEAPSPFGLGLPAFQLAMSVALAGVFVTSATCRPEYANVV